MTDRRISLRGLATLLAGVLGACGGPSEPLLDECELPGLVAPDSITEGPVAFTNVRVLTMRSDEVLLDQTVVVVDGRISDIGPVAEVSIPAGATTIDGTCRYLVPGLADMHVHVRTSEELMIHLANGVTFVREMWGHPGLRRARDSIAAGVQLGPTMYVGTPGFDGDPPKWPTSVVLADPSEADAAVERYQGLGYDFLKIYESLPPEMHEALATAALARDFPFAGHNPAPTGIDRVLTSGQRSVEHFTNLQQHLGAPGTTPGWWDEAMSAPRMADMAERFQAAGVWSVPTLSIMTVDFTDAELASHTSSPEAGLFPPRLFDIWADEGVWLEPGRGRNGIGRQRQLLKAMVDAGAPLLVGTDAGFSYILAGFSFHEEVARYVEAGLTPYETLLAATTNAAAFLGQEDEFGRIEIGLRADMLLVEGNPLQDIGALTRRAGLIVRGRWYTQEALWDVVDAQLLPGAALGETWAGSPTPVPEPRSPGSDFPH